MRSATASSSSPSRWPYRSSVMESREISARGQAILNDPAGAKLLQDYQQLLERALNAGNIDVATKAAETVRNLQFREDEVRRSERAHQEAQENAQRILREQSDRRID
jgi:hypothetical protein